MNNAQILKNKEEKLLKTWKKPEENIWTSILYILTHLWRYLEYNLMAVQNKTTHSCYIIAIWALFEAQSLKYKVGTCMCMGWIINSQCYSCVTVVNVKIVKIKVTGVNMWYQIMRIVSTCQIWKLWVQYCSCWVIGNRFSP